MQDKIKVFLGDRIGATLPEVRYGTVLFESLTLPEDEILLEVTVDPHSGARIFQTVPLAVFDTMFGEAFDNEALALALDVSTSSFAEATPESRGIYRKEHLLKLNGVGKDSKGYESFIAALDAEGALAR